MSTVEFVSPKDLHMSATVLYTGLELTVKVRNKIKDFNIQWRKSNVLSNSRNASSIVDQLA